MFGNIIRCFVLGTFAFLLSCTEPTEPVESLKIEDFQPLAIGKYWIYQVDSISYASKGNNIDTSRTFVKEQIIGSEDTDLGKKAIVEISSSSYQDSLYTYTRTESILLEENRLIYSQNNLQFIKLTSPVQLDSRIPWNGNALFDANFTEIFVKGESLQLYKDWEYRYDSFKEKDLIGEVYATNVLTVEQVDWDDVLSKRYAIEKYAKGIGLFQQIHKIYDTQCNDCPDKSWEEKAEKGYSLIKTLVSFGG